jgi:hypothetical protein
MKLLEILRGFVHKAKQEASKEYWVAAAADKRETNSEGEKKGYTQKGWIGVDLDGTLACVDTLSDISKIGDPVPQMVNLVKKLLQEGHRIKIFTARASDTRQVAMIHKWLKHIGLPEFEVTNIKDFEMIRLYDDRAVQVIANTGKLVETS